MNGKLVYNEKLGYNVDITARLWRSALLEWDNSMTAGKYVDLIIGVDGKPLVIPKDAVLYDGEWYVNVYGLITYIQLTDRSCTTAPTRTTALIDSMTDGVVERSMAILTVIDEGIVDLHRSRANRDIWYMKYLDVNYQPTVIRVLTPHTDYSTYHACERAVARHKYDVVHNTQYIADNFGLPADRW